MSLPRIVTLDPTWTISRTLRGVLDILDMQVVQIDSPDANLAYDEVARGCDLLVAAYEIDRNLKGFEVALRIKQDFPETQVIVIGNENDPEEFDEETNAESPYVYLSRPFDAARFLRIVEAGLNGDDIKAAMYSPAAVTSGGVVDDWGPVPGIDVNAVRSTVDTLLIDLGAMAVFLATRNGEILIESGAVGYLNREQLMNTVTPTMLSGIKVKDLVGGQLNTLLFFDGDDLDLFVLSVGLHHYLCIVYEGQAGSRQFGVVNRFGRKTVEDLIAALGANAFFIQRAAPKQEEPSRTAPRNAPRRARPQEEEEELLTLEKAQLVDIPSAEATPPALELELDPIEASEEDLAALFGAEFDLDGEDLFDLDDVEELAKQNSQNQKGILDRKKAEELGLL